MDIAEVRSEFEYVRENRRRIEMLRAQAEALRLSCIGRAIQYDKDTIQTSPEDYQAKAIAKAADMDIAADKLIVAGDKVRAKLLEWMEVCTDKETVVLTNHYFNGMTYREIEFECDEVLGNRSYARAHQIAQDGLQKISKNIKT